MGKRGNPAWRKGVSGNPGGRTKGSRGLRLALDAKYGQSSEKLLPDLDKLAHDDNPKVRVDAIKLILAYQHGTPVQSHELAGPDGAPLRVIEVHSPHA